MGSGKMKIVLILCPRPHPSVHLGDLLLLGSDQGLSSAPSSYTLGKKTAFLLPPPVIQDDAAAAASFSSSSPSQPILVKNKNKPTAAGRGRVFPPQGQTQLQAESSVIYQKLVLHASSNPDFT